MHPYIDLKRRFVERQKYDPDELIAAGLSGKRLEWAKVLANRFSLIVAPANFGKTFEMRERAAQMRLGEASAFFVSLRKVAERRNLDKALDSDNVLAFRTWRASPTSLLTVFVDSLDEASASKHDGIEYLVTEVAEALHWPNANVRWVISTRPAVLTADIMARLTSILVKPVLLASTSGSTTSSTVSAGATSIQPMVHDTAADPERLRLYSMVPLDSKQAELYVRTRHPALDVAAVLRVARERGLAGFTSSPGGLDVIAHIDLDRHPPDSLTDVFQRVIDAVQTLQSQDHRIEYVGDPLSPAALAEAAQKLASASQVCQLANIEIPEEKLGITDGVLSARLILNPFLTEKALSQLLNSQLFIDVDHHQVKLYPDELPPFLAAQRLSRLVRSPQHAHKLVEAFCWRSPTGEQGVYRQFLPLMGWLATLNQHCREEILERDPQAVAFFGDLRNSSVPLSAAEDALRESIRRLAEQGDRLGRGLFNLTSENFWQAGADSLRPMLRTLFKDYGGHSRARHALLDIAISARSDALRDLVLDAHGRDYERLLLQSIDVRYLAELGLEDDLAGLAHALKVQDKARQSVVALMLPKLGWTHFTPKELASLIYRQFESGRGGLYMSSALEEGRLDGASDQQLFVLSRSLIVRAARLRDRPGELSKQRGRAEDRYIEFVTEVLAALVSRRSFAEHRRVALLCLVTQRVISSADLGSNEVSDLRHALQENTAVGRSFLSLIVKRAGKDKEKLWENIYGYESICSPTAADVEALNVAGLTALFEGHKADRATQQESQQSVPRAKEERRKMTAEAKEQLLGMLDKLRDGSATNGLAWTAGWLLQTNPNSKYGEVQIDVLESAAGPEIVQAVRQGFSKVWRDRQPTYKEDEPRSTSQITAAGLQGLHLELEEGASLPQFTDDEVQNALRYGVFEINGYPEWFWPLVRAHEEVAVGELVKMVKRASAGAVSLEHAEELFISLEDAPQSVQTKLAPLAWTFLQESRELRPYVIEKLLKVATEFGGVASQDDFEIKALAKMEVAFSDPLPKDQEHAGKTNAVRKEAVVWATSWLKTFPSSFCDALQRWETTSPRNAHAFIFELAARLGDDRGAGLVRLAQASDDGVRVLGDLYRWTLEVVRPEDDNDRSDGGVYTPNDRDHAEQLRDALIPAIAAARSQNAYEVLEQLRLEATGSTAMYLQNVQFEMREAQFARTALAQQKYNDFERDFIADISDTTSFAMAIHSDLLAVKYDIEKGEYSLRRFFSDLDFRRLTSDAAGLALEADFQRLLASELHHLSKDRYSVTVEPHTAEAKRRDILCSKGSGFASIELKMSKRWTVEQYLEALEQQLVGQYMRHGNATIGFLVVVLQDADRMWKDANSGNEIDFAGLLKILGDKALALESQNRKLYIRVIGIDATSPPNFRPTRTVKPKRDAKSR